MKYAIIPIVSTLFLVYLWTFDPIEFRIKPLSQIDSTTKIILDTVPIAYSPAPTNIIYYPEPKTDLLSMSNEIITMVIGLGNIFVLYKQLKSRR